ncbi:uncharacterized protein LOC108098903 isoform X2 [Drosophila ficusphila]|uniref:uncharacterized protein LOC108098903 isoform X2 n=1 Tax=Drosophila ficusphila TaxID=30025 RepID=UPI0007E87CF6|nr:uncharacterized protein LOC108098903 isoform X2 [Drosophila ficusphila]
MLDLPEFNFIPPRNDIVNDFLKMPTNLSKDNYRDTDTTGSWKDWSGAKVRVRGQNAAGCGALGPNTWVAARFPALLSKSTACRRQVNTNADTQNTQNTLNTQNTQNTQNTRNGTPTQN